MLNGDNEKFVKILNEFIENRVNNIFTSLPAEIVKIHEQNKVDVKVTIDYAGGENKIPRLPNLVGIPVVFPRSPRMGLTWKLELGDPVLITFSKYSLDDWLQLKRVGGIDTTDPNFFQASDAIAVPGLFPFNFTPPETNGLLLWQDDTIIEIDSGVVKIGGRSAKKLVTEAFADVFNNHKHPMDVPATPFIGFTDPPTTTLTSAELTSKALGE